MCDCVCAQSHWVMDFVDELCCMHLAHQSLSTVTPYWSCLACCIWCRGDNPNGCVLFPKGSSQQNHAMFHHTSGAAQPPNPTSGPRHLPRNPSKFYRRNSSFHPCRTRRHGSLKSHGLWRLIVSSPFDGPQCWIRKLHDWNSVRMCKETNDRSPAGGEILQRFAILL